MRRPWGCIAALLLAAVAGGFLLGRSSRPSAPAGPHIVTQAPSRRRSQPDPGRSAHLPHERRRHPSADVAGRAVIIIDDLGASRRACERFLRVPADLTFSFLPAAPLAQTLSREVAAQGRCVMLHLPMQPVDEARPLEPDTITVHMTGTDIDALVGQALAAVPLAEGVNNHMGSRATLDEDVMRAVLRPCAQRGLFFVDSRTIGSSVAAKVARQLGVPVLERDVFLDAEGSRDAAGVTANMQSLARLARANGLAVGIGHPFASTAEGIERSLAYFEDAGVAIVPASGAF